MIQQSYKDGRRLDEGTVAARLRSIREEMCGDDDGTTMAKRLGVPLRTWLNYERGVTIPGDILLRFLLLTAVEPLWLLEGRGATYRIPTSGVSVLDVGTG